uniref:Uncharacterized protein n=1 Tax=Oryza nivara TaxID=4536 RepID=A0A0E0IPM0_ORYNI
MGSNEPSLLVIPKIPPPRHPQNPTHTCHCLLHPLHIGLLPCHGCICPVKCRDQVKNTPLENRNCSHDHSHETKVVSTLKYEADEADKKGLHLLGEEE